MPDELSRGIANDGPPIFQLCGKLAALVVKAEPAGYMAIDYPVLDDLFRLAKAARDLEYPDGPPPRSTDGPS